MSLRLFVALFVSLGLAIGKDGSLRAYLSQSKLGEEVGEEVYLLLDYQLAYMVILLVFQSRNLV